MGVIINWRLIIINNSDSVVNVGIMDVASLSLSRQHLPSFLNCHKPPFPTIRVSFNHDNPTSSNSWNFSPTKDSRYAVSSYFYSKHSFDIVFPQNCEQPLCYVENMFRLEKMQFFWELLSNELKRRKKISLPEQGLIIPCWLLWFLLFCSRTDTCFIWKVKEFEPAIKLILMGISFFSNVYMHLSLFPLLTCVTYVYSHQYFTMHSCTWWGRK